MAMGNQVVAENGLPWQTRLMREHHYKCEELYLAELAPLAVIVD